MAMTTILGGGYMEEAQLLLSPTTTGKAMAKGKSKTGKSKSKTGKSKSKTGKSRSKTGKSKTGKSKKTRSRRY